MIIQKLLYSLILISFSIITSLGQHCVDVQKDSLTRAKTNTTFQTKLVLPDFRFLKPEQIGEFVRRIYQDKAGNHWFGTNQEGVARYDGQSLKYFLSGYAVRAITEDESGKLWFATSGGVFSYDGKSFINYTMADGLRANQVWSILKDRSGKIWFGTESGISIYDGKTFISFSIPEVDLSDFPNAYPSPKLINCIYQDKSGKIWFGSNGGGAYFYDGKSLSNISEKDGLCNNFVQTIIEDNTGKLWFGTRFGGMSSYDGKTFTNYNLHYPVAENLHDNFVWAIYQDSNGNIWIATAGGGLHRFDGNNFTNYDEKDGLSNKFIQSIFQDKNGTIWIGASGGLFRFNGKSFINVTKYGPWK
ncbi:MAG TPA: two-component regulator propeller domain-containing protein [Saprospiraceae bacterium]|nr:two-component regulator propeller domain-containing protein [Saprospiraceae bacterium]